MSYQHILFDIKEKIAWLTFNRPEQLNAMNAQMMNEIIHALQAIDNASPHEVRVAVITGTGKAFMAGADIKEYARQTKSQFESFQSTGYTLYATIESNSKPVIAAVNGYAFGGGLEIALACDMIVAVEGAKMGLPEILLNLIPGGGGIGRLAKKIGSNRTNEIVMTGRTVLAEEMHGLGVINHIYPLGQFIERVTQFAAVFSDKLPEQLRTIKQISRLTVGSIPSEAQETERRSLVRFYESKEGQEKIREFYNKSLEKNK